MRSFRAAALRAALIPFVAVLAAVLAACTGSGQAGWTYAPASAAPAASGAPSGAAGSPGASGPAGSPGASGSIEPGPGGTEITVVATTPLKFDTPDLSVAADEPFTLIFDNQDPTVPHNVVIKNPDGSSVPMGDTTFFTGPDVRRYEVGGLTAGEYPFLCEVHPTAMTGTLTVQ